MCKELGRRSDEQSKKSEFFNKDLENIKKNQTEVKNTIIEIRNTLERINSSLDEREDNGTHSSTLAWEIPWTEEPGGLQSMGLQRVGHDLATSLSFFSFFKVISEGYSLGS